MAQELLESHPESINQDQYGFYSVNYDSLGMKMLKLEDWKATNKKR